jgi:hypothetical protein
MGDIVAAIYYVLQDEALTYFACKAFFNEQRQIKYSPDGIVCPEENDFKLLLIKQHHPQLYSFLEKKNLLIIFEASCLQSWIMLSFNRLYKLDNSKFSLFRYWDRLFSNPYPLNIYEIYTAISILMLAYPAPKIFFLSENHGYDLCEFDKDIKNIANTKLTVDQVISSTHDLLKKYDSDKKHSAFKK